MEATQLETWPRLESVVYLVELCTTPDTVGALDAKGSEPVYLKYYLKYYLKFLKFLKFKRLLL